jgi:hypothetical protein
MKPQFNFNHIVVSDLSCELTLQNSRAKTCVDRIKENNCNMLGRIEVKQKCKGALECSVSHFAFFYFAYLIGLDALFLHMQFISAKLVARN